jgi:hypothetical protein
MADRTTKIAISLDRLVEMNYIVAIRMTKFLYIPRIE